MVVQAAAVTRHSSGATPGLPGLVFPGGGATEV